MKCYEEGCEKKVTTFCIVEDYVACAEHAIGDYFWKIEEVSA